MKYEDPKRYKKWNVEDLVMVTEEQHRKLHGKQFREDVRNRTMRAFILCRQSGGVNDPEESLSLEVQESSCLKLAEDKGIHIAGIFREASTSGRLYPLGFENIAAQDMIYKKWCEETKKIGQYRKGLGEILNRLDEVDFVICYDITRLYRPLNGSYLSNIVNQLLQFNKVKVLTLKEGEVDFSRFQDNLISSLTSQINSEQLLIQREKAKAGLKRLKDSGEYYSGFSKTIGYASTGRKNVEIVPREADVVRDIFNLFLKDGLSLNEIVRQIGSKYPDVFPKCYSNTVKNILSNPIYAGYMKNTEGELIRSKQTEGKEIIKLEEWVTADKILTARKTVICRKKENWLPLTPFIYCGHCGEKMRSHLGYNLKPAYSCRRHLREDNLPCKNTLMASYEGKEGCGLLETIKPLLLAEAMRLMQHKDDDELKKQLNEVEIALTGIKRKAQKLTEMFTASEMDESIYDTAMKELRMKEKTLSKQKADLEMELNRDTTQFDWVKLMMKFRGDALTNAEYEILASSMIKKILVYKDFIEVKTTYGDVSIPRQRIYKWRLCLNYELKMKHGEASIYYYYGKARIISNEEYNSSKLVGVIGNVKLFMCE